MSSTPPSRRDRFRPAELLGLAGVVGVFVGLVVLLTARDLILAVIFLGVGFIVSVVLLAMLALLAGDPSRPPAPGDETPPSGDEAPPHS